MKASRFVKELTRQTFDFKPLLLRRENSMYQVADKTTLHEKSGKPVIERFSFDGNSQQMNVSLTAKLPFKQVCIKPSSSYREGDRLISTKSCGTVKLGKDRLSLLEELVADARKANNGHKEEENPSARKRPKLAPIDHQVSLSSHRLMTAKNINSRPSNMFPETSMIPAQQDSDESSLNISNSFKVPQAVKPRES